MVGANVLDKIHFAFFDSVNDGDQIWQEVRERETVFSTIYNVINYDVLSGSGVGRLSRSEKHHETGKHRFVNIFEHSL